MQGILLRYEKTNILVSTPNKLCAAYMDHKRPGLVGVETNKLRQKKNGKYSFKI